MRLSNSEIKPGEKVDVAVNFTPAEKAIAGDYMVTLRANGDGTSDSAGFRVTVTTSTRVGHRRTWNHRRFAAVFAGAVSRYGRR